MTILLMTLTTFAGAFALAQSRPKTVVKCDVAKLGINLMMGHVLKTFDVELVQGIWAEGVPKEYLTQYEVGTRQITMFSNNNGLEVQVREVGQPTSTLPVFSGSYHNLDGAKDKGGFTGWIGLGSADDDGTTSGGGGNKLIAFSCYKPQTGSSSGF